VAHRARKKVQGEVWYSWLCAGKPLANGRKAILQLHIEAHGLRDDEDNRTARMKPVLDSLVDVGALQDDSPQYLEMRIPTRAKGEKGKPRITINIDYLENSGNEETATGGHDEGQPSLSPSPRSDGLLA
jgi:hypothetical protein